MGLTRVTITGADDNTDPIQMAHITNQFPFVEWGVLVSGREQRSSRFPSDKHICRIVDTVSSVSRGHNLSLHVCSDALGQLLRGEWPSFNFPVERFSRVQLNFANKVYDCDHIALAAALGKFANAEIIFGIDGLVDRDIMHGVQRADPALRCVPLYDASHGGGRLPDFWPPSRSWCGYAGGLGPDNLLRELKRISEGCRDCFWVDMESCVRNYTKQELVAGNDTLDLDKVQTCLLVARYWMS